MEDMLTGIYALLTVTEPERKRLREGGPKEEKKDQRRMRDPGKRKSIRPSRYK